ncbi:DNA starvation/stationary phase protection protein [Paenibacillus phoenicis]|uniref:DNA starvation/stationary phase protection protein n=1 Tax=Paenibacillus phoenicis TaxID=554117 RepID=A0ABU5PF39_9BACL|nr:MULTISPECIES: DNA starvation/stationary phase protection protein [Paenibacillus]EES71843.1 DNA protection during starvation protein 2 [Paenibacillus sp. oral taxon 786 str. D14]MEA3568541.1 DNA starvation/stationary phase protection protein [Paenibacillus phoenicis]
MANQTLTQANQELQKQLNLQIANWTVLYTKLHNFHWFVKGPNFFTLHEKFEALYNEAAGYIDDIAERLLAIGGTPIATLREALATASISEASGKESADEMVAAIVADFAKLDSELKEGMEAAERAEDEATSDLLLGIVSSLEKHRWMLNAYLGK